MDEQNILQVFSSFLQENDTIISALGAAAWAPSIVDLFLKAKETFDIHNRKIEMSIIDTFTVNAHLIDGFVLLLAVNMYIPNKSFFAKSISAKILFCNNKSKTV